KEPIKKLIDKESCQENPIENNKLAQDVESIESTNPVNKIYDQMKVLITLVESLTKKDRWNQAEMTELDQKWNAFWGIYNKRAQVLLTYGIDNKSSENQDNSNRETFEGLIWHEIKVIETYYKELTPIGGKIGSFTIN